MPLQVSISLETVEMVASGFARGNPDRIKRLSRRRHAEWHAYCHQLSRLGFTLGIPPELSPGFETNACKWPRAALVHKLTMRAAASESGVVAARRIDCRQVDNRPAAAYREAGRLAHLRGHDRAECRHAQLQRAASNLSLPARRYP